MRLKTFIVALSLSPLFAATAAATEWNHNGSIMELESNGNWRMFIYKSPRPNMPMKPGDVLFKGVRRGNSYVGTAFTFSSRCPSLPFDVQGYVSKDQLTVTMEGQAPRRGATCDDITYFQETLEFTFAGPSSTSTASPLPSNSAPSTAAPSTAVPRSTPQERAPSSAPAPSSKALVILPYINKKYHPSSMSDAAVAYNTCAQLWNEDGDNYSLMQGAKALVVGKSEDSEDRLFGCYYSGNSSSTDNAESLATATKTCRSKKPDCFTFAIGDELTSWAAEQRRAFDRLPSARP